MVIINSLRQEVLSLYTPHSLLSRNSIRVSWPKNSVNSVYCALGSDRIGSGVSGEVLCHLNGGPICSDTILKEHAKVCILDVHVPWMIHDDLLSKPFNFLQKTEVWFPVNLASGILYQWDQEQEQRLGMWIHDSAASKELIPNHSACPGLCKTCHLVLWASEIPQKVPTMSRKQYNSLRGTQDSVECLKENAQFAEYLGPNSSSHRQVNSPKLS